MMENDWLSRIEALYDAYLLTAAELEKNRKFGDGILGLRPGPADDPCHQRFAAELEALLRECAAEASSAEAAEILQLLFDKADDKRMPLSAYWMLIAVQGLGRELIGLLPRLKELDLCGGALTTEEIDALRQEFGALDILYTLRFWGLELPSDSRSLQLDAGAAGGTEELKDALGRLEKLERADLRGAELSLDALEELLPLCPADTRCTVPLCGMRFDSDCTEIDLSGVPVADTAEIERAAALLPKLEKVVMCECGVPDEEMAALNERHPELRFVWTVHFSVYALRTDATVFCASDLPSRGFIAPAASSEELSPLRYCTDLVALDLGHMFFKDLGFLESLTKLKYLIIVEERFHDISVLGKLGELEYLEIFNNTIDDISPLLACKKLRHLNIGYTRGYDPAPLWEMTGLERLWYPGNRMGREKCAALAAALPDTQCFLPSSDRDGSTGGGWRTAEVYFEMRNLFGMFYQPGGTGVEREG